MPFLVRGPGVPKGGRRVGRGVVTSHTDLAATFLGIAGVNVEGEGEGFELDGGVVPLTEGEIGEAEGVGEEVEVEVEVGGHGGRRRGRRHRNRRQEHVAIEMWGIIMSEGKFGADLHRNHTYKALRIVGGEGEGEGGYDLRYTVWCGGERELYDLKVMHLFFSFHCFPFLLRRSSISFRSSRHVFPFTDRGREDIWKPTDASHSHSY